MMALDSKRLSEADEVLSNLSMEKALKQRSANRVQANFLSIAAGNAGGEMRWFVLRTANRTEKDVDNALQDAGIQAWLPMKKIALEVKGTRRRRDVERPVWLGYVFVRVVPCGQSWAGLKAVDGITAILGSDERPFPLADEIMNDLMGLVKTGAFDEKRAQDKHKIGSKVIIADGPFAHFEAVVQGYFGKRGIRVFADIFGRTTVVDLDLAQIVKS